MLRTSRFFLEDDDTHRHLSGENIKANELLHRRLTVEDAADAHIAALERAPRIGFGTFIISAPTSFAREDAGTLKRDAAGVTDRYFPDARSLYAARGWSLPTSIGRVYDARRTEEQLGFRCSTSFADVLSALREGGPLPVAHEAGSIAPQEPS